MAVWNFTEHNIWNEVYYSLVFSQTVIQTKVLDMIDFSSSACTYTTESNKVLRLSENCLARK